MMAHIQGTPTPIRVAHADLGIPDVLTDLVMQCLQKNRELRPSGARQLIGDLEHVETKIDQAEKDKPTGPKRPGHRKPSPGWKFWKS
jgi:hypothetical protein